ncbi:MAG: hypothetical protein KAI79_17945, partial [Bacteroidales bacterium]|nr:hypothetical protein [Bacteroidales bacterium]
EMDKHDRKVDYVLTHTCPARMIPEFAMFKLDNVFCATGKFLNEVDNLMEFKEWHFGHMHVEETYIDDDEGNQDSYTCHYNNPVYELK